MIIVKRTGRSDENGGFAAERTEVLFHRLALEEADAKMRSFALEATGIDIGQGRFLVEWPEGLCAGAVDGTAWVWAEKTPYTPPLMVVGAEGSDRVYAEAWNLLVHGADGETAEYAAIPDM